MGQMALGLLWGCPAPSEWERSVAEGRDADTHWVIARFEKTLKSYEKKLKGRPCPLVRREALGDRAMVGVWVAVGGSGEPGVPYLGEKCVSLKSVEYDYGDSIDRAKDTFRKFSKYVAENESVSLSPAELWLIPTEVA